MSSPFETLFQQCTVKLTVPGVSGNGTGFFVAPDSILTCAHVAEKATNKRLVVQWNGQKKFAEAAVKKLHQESDLALLKLIENHPEIPCVFLGDGYEINDELYIFGYPDEGLGDRDGRPATVIYEGETDGALPLMQLKFGQIRPGISGSPIYNPNNKRVCGVVKISRDRSSLMGGGGIPIETVFKQFPELKQQNREFHGKDSRWQDVTRQIVYTSPTEEPEEPSFKDNTLYWTGRIALTLLGAIALTIGTIYMFPDYLSLPTWLNFQSNTTKE